MRSLQRAKCACCFNNNGFHSYVKFFAFAASPESTDLIVGLGVVIIGITE
jgi:hypothetical protein